MNSSQLTTTDGRDAGVRAWDKHARITVARSTADLIACPSFQREELSLHLLLPLEGTVLMAGCDATSALAPGQLAVLLASAAASTRFSTPSSVIVLSFPGSIVDVAPSRLLDHATVPIDTTSGVPAAFASLLRSLVDVSTPLTQPQLALHLSDAVTALLAATLLDANYPRRDASHGRSDAIFLAVRRWIEDHLAQQGLSITAIAEGNHISPSYLQKLFAAEGSSVTSWVRERRCERCRRDLADPAQRDVGIAMIAERWGFASAAHFSRVFTAHYGITPRDYRAASRRPSRAAGANPQLPDDERTQ